MVLLLGQTDFPCLNQVFVTFDEETTKQWVLVSVLAGLTTWAYDALWLGVATLAVAHCRCKRHSYSLRQVGALVRTTTSRPRRGGLTVRAQERLSALSVSIGNQFCVEFCMGKKGA